MRVQNLEVNLQAFVHVKRKRMALKNITIVKWAEEIDGEGYHTLVCEHCGGQNAQAYIADVMYGTFSSDWMERQILHLSEEEGWNNVLSTRMGYTENAAENYIVRLPVLYEILANRHCRKLLSILNRIK